MEEKIAYKVVTKHSRKSYGKHGIFTLAYKKGKTVKTHKNTIGIFCFDDYYDASELLTNDTEIIKVKPIGKGTRPKYGALYSSYIQTFFRLLKISKKSYIYIDERLGIMTLPRGTVCYPAVKVLE